MNILANWFSHVIYLICTCSWILTPGEDEDNNNTNYDLKKKITIVVLASLGILRHFSLWNNAIVGRKALQR